MRKKSDEKGRYNINCKNWLCILHKWFFVFQACFLFFKPFGNYIEVESPQDKTKKKRERTGKKIDYCLFSLCCTQNLASTSYIIYLSILQLFNSLHSGTFAWDFSNYNSQYSTCGLLWKPPLTFVLHTKIYN